MLYNAHPERYAQLRRVLLIEGIDSPPLHGWVSAIHDNDVIDETAAAFDRAFRRLADVPGFRRT
jgi:glutamate-1-semialdehyde aminotransferase